MFFGVGILYCLTLPTFTAVNLELRNELSKEYMTGGEPLPNAHPRHVSTDGLLPARTSAPVCIYVHTVQALW